nr:hypothetical protein Itr_chr07CG11770 [Ipomoea trifida]GMD12903.1 hypothetical protein Iba_chr07aCG7920 [Ipomoea batatas]
MVILLCPARASYIEIILVISRLVLRTFLLLCHVWARGLRTHCSTKPTIADEDTRHSGPKTVAFPDLLIIMEDVLPHVSRDRQFLDIAVAMVYGPFDFST